VNAVGDIIDPRSGTLVAGVRTPDGKRLADARKLLRGSSTAPARGGQNTTIGVVATNARLTKVQATKVAQMAQDGFARAIYPSHTMGDGDVIFALSTGQIETSDVSRIGALAADATVEAILRAVRAATSILAIPLRGTFNEASGYYRHSYWRLTTRRTNGGEASGSGDSR
jgi:L-aminopeptidase/D-esterase-like protein